MTTPLVPGMTGQHIGWVLYALACLEMADCITLTKALVGRSEALLAAQLRSGSWADDGGRNHRPDNGFERVEEYKSGLFAAADFANLVWGLGTLRFRPSTAWMDALCRSLL